MLRHLKATLAVPGLFGLCMMAGCADLQDRIDEITGGQQSIPRNLAFACDNNRELTTRFSSDREQARVDTGNNSYDLQYSGRDNGMRVYSDNDEKVRLSVSSNRAYLRIPDGTDFKDCERT
jgi:hypothetical protein